MLELKKIRKEYPAGEGKVVALKGVDLLFRHSEFVSILGPSGCGKTTLLNIIGGLDQYTDGDLVINGKSTKDFTDRDWDAYRNRSIGFVFQSYNLIPHQSVLQNVELALTLSGVSKSERKKRAKEALEKVGLGSQLNKKPNQMSGGQMQRVAIARALVNDPDIILADEPTGALDTETSVQVMEILKEISKDRLIVMVTHNPDLAEEYSSRIVRILDGELLSDSMPLSEEEIAAERERDAALQKENKKTKKPSMSFATSFMLSLKNLFTKKGRTILTAFAGSIGIIGIALIASVSEGMTSYIDDVQESALSSYPLSIESRTLDLSSVMETFMNIRADETSHEKDAVYKKSAVTDIVNALSHLEESENDLASFKTYLENEVADEESPLHTAVNGIQYSYGLDLLIYTKNVDGEIVHSDTQGLLRELIIDNMSTKAGNSMSTSTGAGNGGAFSGFASMGMGGMSTGLWQELLPGNDGALVNDLITKQYDLVYGSWPNDYDEVILILDGNNELDDMTLYALGLLPKEDMDAIVKAAVDGNEVENKSFKMSYEEICSREYRTILNADCYSYDDFTKTFTDLRDTDAGLRYLYDNALSLKVVGVIRPGEDSDTTMLSGTIGYTADLTKYLIEKAGSADVITAQKDDPTRDVLTGLPFEANRKDLSDKEKKEAFLEHVKTLEGEEKAEFYIGIKSIPSDEFLKQQTDATVGTMDRAGMEGMILQGLTSQMSVSEEEITEYLAAMTDEELTEIFTQMVEESVKAQYAAGVRQQMAQLPPEQLSMALDAELESYTESQCAEYYDSILEFSSATYEDNLRTMGDIDLDTPRTVNIYASSFENKDKITEAIADYNEEVDDVQRISYTDYVGILMSSVTTIIHVISYVLMAFVGISLVVSSIMIGVITLISVQERTKEIGILRAIGASKRDVSSMFNAETMIIGFVSGLIGVGMTYLLCIPINALLHYLTGIGNLNAKLPTAAAVVLVLISVLLTLIAGIIPSRSAAKKDPVVALRTE